MGTKRPKRHLHVAFKPSGNPELAAVEKVFNQATDWYRYIGNCWLLYTSLSPKTWTERLRKVPGMEDASILICAFDPHSKETDGFLPQEAWDWLNKHYE